MKNRLNYSKILLKAQKYISDGILIFDAKGKNIPLVYLNKSISKLLGYRNAELIGKSPQFLENSVSLSSDLYKLRNSFSQKSRCTTDLFIKKKNGKNIFCRIVVTPIPDSNGSTDAFVCVLRDITEIRKNLINNLQLSVVESTLRTVNDIVFNYMNNTQLFRMECEEKKLLDKNILHAWDQNHNIALKKLKRLNELKEYKEKILGEKLTMLSIIA